MQTPLWLNLKKEYIDDNFDSLLSYLKDYSGKVTKDSFYDTTLHLLRERVQGLVTDYCALPIFEENEADDKTFDLRLLAAYLLLNDTDQLATSAYLALMRLMLGTQHKFALQIMKNVSGRLRSRSIVQHGYSWSDLIDYKPGVFAYKAIHNVIFGPAKTDVMTYENHGSALLTGRGLNVTPTHLEASKTLLTAGAESLAIDSLIALRTSASAKLKQSQENSLLEVHGYMEDFRQEQAKVTPGSHVKKLHSYTDGEEVTVRITDINYSGVVFVETTDPSFEPVRGRIVFTRPSILYYYTSLIPHQLKVGNTFPALLTDLAKGIFQIDEQMVKFIVEECRENTGTNEYLLESVLIDLQPKHYVWLTVEGTPIYTEPNDEYAKGEYALINITEYETGRRYGLIKGEIEERVTQSSDMFSEAETRNKLIQRFATSGKIFAPVAEKATDRQLSTDTLALLMRLLFHYQKDLLKPSDRFRFLMNARSLAGLLGDEADDSYLRFASTYLLILVQFTHHGDIAPMTLLPDERYKDARPTRIRMLIVDLLRRYGHEGYSDELARMISDYEHDIPIIAKLARLVQTANTMSETLSSSALNIIRREVIRTLSLETENDTDLEDEGGQYLGVESGTQEFKQSVVYPPNNQMQPSVALQMKNVMRGVCAFLNSETGGTLYVGVNDQGYVTGIEGDMKALHCLSIDSYMRYIQDEAIRMMGVDAGYYLRLEPLFDNRSVAIHVESHPYRIVEMDGEAYVRINAESRLMPDSVREAVSQRKFKQGKGKSGILSQFYQALSAKRKVILHNYASGNSLTIADREVEPYDIHPEDNLVVGFDVVKNAVRVYHLSRIGYAEVTEDPWRFTSRHEFVQVDDFHMAGTQPIRVNLQLDLLSRNLLVEEYPSAARHLTADKRSGAWYYDADVYQMEGIGRFYIGLANHITILKAPELESYVKEYKEKYL